ncbi:MAG TPA: enoyl-CoA hydratase-related protein [Dehalococcoidales bacterium]|nr:enoyl-CoA hydratase-related protein [Dehalococcoidales bacterium]
MLVSQENGIITLTVNRPEKRNALTPDIFSRLTEALRSAGKEGVVRVVVLRGAGEKAFSSGYEISRLHGPEESDFQDPLEDVILAIETCAVPVIAMIYGYCIGAGVSLATACDLRLAADNARLGVTAARLGVVYPPSALRRLINLVGVSATRELLYTGRLVDAGRARDIRLVDEVVPADRLATVTYDLAREIAGNSPISVRGTKKMISRLLDSQSISPVTREEFLELQKQAAASQDLREGKKAFAEKRKPEFRNK